MPEGENAVAPEQQNRLKSGDLGSWWTPDGWTLKPVPEPFIALWLTFEDWEEARRRVGYEVVHDSQEFIFPEYEIARHGDGHLYLSWDCGDRFFVAKEHAAAFWLDKYRALARTEAAQRQADAAEQLAKAMIGFVRHGHGRTVIDEHGTESLEEREQRLDNWRRRQAETAAKKQADKVPAP